MNLYIKQEFSKQIGQFKNQSHELLTAQAPVQLLSGLHTDTGVGAEQGLEEVSLITAQFDDGAESPAKSRIHCELKKIVCQTTKQGEKTKD